MLRESFKGISLYSCLFSFALVASPVTTALAEDATTSEGEQATEVEKSAPKEGAKKVEELVVTGSRIKGMDLTSSAPVTVLTRAEIDAAGLTSIGDILQHLPSQSGAANTQSNNGGDGSTRVSLRGLGASRTLVLLNGRRYVPGGSGANSSVDLNSIPAAVIERVEVLKDGASAVYGSDAIGGVINIITKADYDGVDGSIYYGMTGDGKAETLDISVTTGHRTKKGHILFSAGYHKQKPLWTSDRDFSKTDKAYDWEKNDGSWDPNGSSATPEGHIIDRAPPAPDAETATPEEIDAWNARYGGNEAWAAIPAAAEGDLHRDSNGNWRGFNYSGNSDDGSGDLYNYQPQNYLLTPQERYNFFSTGSYELSSSIRSYFEASYTNRRSKQKLAPTPLFIISEGITVAADNQYNPFGREFIDIRRRFVEEGNRVFLQDISTYRLVLGLDGDLPVLDNWFWDSSFVFGRTSGTSVNEGRFIRSRVIQALGPADQCVGDCVALDLFGGPGSITPEMLDYIGYTGIGHGYSDQRIWQLNLNGDLFELPGGIAGMAIGYAFREESGGYIPDPITATGNTTGNKEESTEGNYDVHEAYAEFLLPIVGDLPGIENLELSAAARFFDYSSFGSDFMWKVGLKWQVIEDLTLRGTYSTAFRAPSVSEMYLGTSDSFPLVGDPCSNVDEAGNPRELTAEQQANCAEDGVPATHEDSRAQLHAIVGGNDKLNPETATTLTAGLVYTPSFLEGLSLTLDYYNVSIKNAITTMGADILLSSCYSQADSEYCDKIIRDNQTNLITDINDTLTNIGGTDTSGVDFNLGYRLATSVGRFGFGLHGTWLEKYNVTLPDGREIEGKGVYDLGVNPDIKANANLRWSLDEFGAGMNVRFVGAFEECENDDCTIEDAKRRDVESNTTVDLYTSYVFNIMDGMGDSALSVGVNNILDTKPAVIYNGFLGTSDASAYDFVGRYVYLRLTQSL